MVLDERANLASAEDVDNETREKERALDQLGFHHPQEVKVEDGEREIHDHSQLHLKPVHLQVFENLRRYASFEARQRQARRISC